MAERKRNADEINKAIKDLSDNWLHLGVSPETYDTIIDCMVDCLDMLNNVKQEAPVEKPAVHTIRGDDRAGLSKVVYNLWREYKSHGFSDTTALLYLLDRLVSKHNAFLDKYFDTIDKIYRATRKGE